MNPERPVGRSLGWNAAAVLVTQISPPVFNAGFIVLLARTLGAEPLGAYSVLVTAFMVLDQMRTLGLPRYVTRELAARGAVALDMYRGLRAVAAAGGFVAAALLIWYVRANGLVPLAAAAVFAIAFIPSTAVSANDALFLAWGRADLNARVALTESAVRAIVSTLIVWLRGPDVVALGVVYAGSRTIAAILGRYYRRELVGPIAAGADWTAAQGLWRHVPAFFTVIALPMFVLRADLIVVGWFGSTTQLGMYSAASRLVSIFLLVPDSLMIANFVRLSSYSDRQADFRRQLLKVVGGTLVVVVPMALGITLLAPRLVATVYGAKFAPAVPFMQWLIWSVPLFSVTRAIGDALVALGYQTRVAVVTLATAVTSAMLYMLFVGAWGVMGIAPAYVATIGAMLLYSIVAAISVWIRSPWSPPCFADQQAVS